jgi:transcriptional regulator with XRE-family HTH domain
MGAANPQLFRNDRKRKLRKLKFGIPELKGNAMADEYKRTLRARFNEETDSIISASIKARMRKHDDMMQKELSIETGISEGALSESLTGKRKFQPGELRRIAEYFHMTYEELFTGVAPRNVVSHERTGLSSFAIDWLHDVHTAKEKEHIAEMVDIVLDNEAIADMLFMLLYMYATTRPHASIAAKKEYRTAGQQLMPNLAFDLTDTESILKFAVTERLSKVLESIKKEYTRLDNSTYSLAMEEVLHEQLIALGERFAAREKRMDEADGEENLLDEYVADDSLAE